MLARKPLDRMNAHVMEAFGDAVRLHVDGTTYLVDAMFRAPWQGIAVSGHPVDRSRYSITIDRADFLRTGVKSGDTATVETTTYTVRSIKPDDGGMVMLELGQYRG